MDNTISRTHMKTKVSSDRFLMMVARCYQCQRGIFANQTYRTGPLGDVCCSCAGDKPKRVA